MSITAEDHEKVREKKTQNRHKQIYQSYYHLLCFHTGGKYIKSVILIWVHDFLKQMQDYSALHLNANKNSSLS